MNNVIPIDRNARRLAAIEQAKQQERINSQAHMYIVDTFFRFLHEHKIFNQWLKACTQNHLQFLQETPPSAWLVAISCEDGGDEFWWPLHETWSSKFNAPN